MPSSAAQTARRKRLAYEAARRRQAVTMLQITEATCRYAAAQLGDGASPEEARQTAVFVAGELAVVAAALRRLTRLSPGERRSVAAMLAALGMPRREIADRLGVCERAVRGYLKGTRPRPVQLVGGAQTGQDRPAGAQACSHQGPPARRGAAATALRVR